MSKVFRVVLASVGAIVSMLVPSHAHAMAIAEPSPILMVHGIDVSAPSGIDCATTWDDVKRFLRGHGFERRPLLTISYYEHDSNCDRSINDSTGSSGQAYFDAPGTHAGAAGGHTANAQIEHLAYHLAWYIHDHYSALGVRVDVVAHSMGGLIARYAVGEVEQRNPAFPPALLVDNAVTLATPHGGAREGRLALCGLLWRNRECSEMEAGSSLLTNLQSRAWNPQGADGTDWTALGSDADASVAADRAVGASRDRSRDRYFGGCHKVWYPVSRLDQRSVSFFGIESTRTVLVPQPIDHDGFMHDGADAATDLLSYATSADCGAPLVERRHQPHSLGEISRALDSHGY